MQHSLTLPERPQANQAAPQGAPCLGCEMICLYDHEGSRLLCAPRHEALGLCSCTRRARPTAPHRARREGRAWASKTPAPGRSARRGNRALAGTLDDACEEVSSWIF